MTWDAGTDASASKQLRAGEPRRAVSVGKVVEIIRSAYFATAVAALRYGDSCGSIARKATLPEVYKRRHVCKPLVACISFFGPAHALRARLLHLCFPFG